MDYRTAGFVVFWLTLVATLAWSAYGRIDMGTVFLVLGILSTEMAFLASRLETAFPWPGHVRLGFLSAEIIAKQRFVAFDSVRFSMQPALGSTPFILIAHAKKAGKNAKKNAEKFKTKFGRVQGLQETDIREKTAVAFFQDEKDLKPSIRATLSLLEKVWK